MLPDYIEYLVEGPQHIQKLSSSEGNVFRGLLIKPGEWKGYTYTEDELKKAIPTLVGKMITLDHDDRFDSHVGIITNAFWDDTLGGVVIDFKVIDPNILEKLNAMAEEGLLNQVGLSAELSYMTITNDSNREVKGITFKKATLTFYPAVGDARLITKLSLDRYALNIVEQRDDGTLLVELIPTEELAKKDDKYPYPAPDAEAGKAYPAPAGYPIPPDEWKAVKDAIADLQKRVAELEKKLVKNSEDNTDDSEVELSTNVEEKKEVNEAQSEPQPQEQEQAPQPQTVEAQAPSAPQPVQQAVSTTAQDTQSTTTPTPQVVQTTPSVPQEPQTPPQQMVTQVPQTQEPLVISKDEPVKEEEPDPILKELEEKPWAELSVEAKKKIVEELLKGHPLFSE